MDSGPTMNRTYFLTTHFAAVMSFTVVLPSLADTREKLPEPIAIQLEGFGKPSDAEKEEIGEYLLELELVPKMADRIAFVATGTYFLAGKGKEAHISNLRQYATGWSLDNRQDRERLMVINQRLLNPKVVDRDRLRMMQSDTSQLDRLRVKSTYHEANGSSIYEPGPKSQIEESLRAQSVFFPTRAATKTPLSCWTGHALDYSKPSVTIGQLIGTQPIGRATVALFEYHPADYYVFYVALSFVDGSPVQCDAWRQFRPKKNKSNPPPSKEEIEKERQELMSGAKHVARVQSSWRQLGAHAVPVFIHGVTLDDVYEVELVAEIQWFVNEQVNPESFEVESIRQLGPFAVAKNQDGR